MHISSLILSRIVSSNARRSNHSALYSFNKYTHLVTLLTFLYRNRGMDINYHMSIQTFASFTILVYCKINLT